MRQKLLAPVRGDRLPGGLDCPVVEHVRDLFASSPYLPLRRLGCEYHDGVLVIYGRVPTYYLKQLAQTVAGQVAEVQQIVNQVQVVPPSARPLRPTAWRPKPR